MTVWPLFLLPFVYSAADFASKPEPQDSCASRIQKVYLWRILTFSPVYVNEITAGVG
jgi:hypothetical protein